MKNGLLGAIALFSVLFGFACSPSTSQFTGAKGEVKLITLDPGHFHAALIQKSMYEQVHPVVHVYAPEGPDVKDHLNRIHGFNTRETDPTSWDQQVYTGPDYLEKMLTAKKGNVVVLSGQNNVKTDYIKKSVDAGLHVFSDKPMCINKAGFELLKSAFESAGKNDVLLYDIMTERYEITTMLQKALSRDEALFGTLETGSVDNPAVTKESVHHFFKTVSGNPIKRPAWYFDTESQGEGIVDVTTHLVDLVQWECFPEVTLDYEKDIEVLRAHRWPTEITKAMFKKVTRLDDFTNDLKSKLDENGNLLVYANGEIDYTIKGVHAKVSVIWNFQAPEGSKDTHMSIMRGTRANIVIRQGREENYKPELYVEATEGSSRETISPALEKAIGVLKQKYPGLGIIPKGKTWRIDIPDELRIGHEAHFAQVTKKYLQFLANGKLPDWEVPNMLAKYYTNIKALEIAED